MSSSSDGSSSQESSNTVVPLLTVSDNVPADDADHQDTSRPTRYETAPTQTVTEVHSADEPVVIPDHSLTPNDTSIQLANNGTPEPLSYSSAASFTAETTEPGRSVFSINTSITTTYSVETTATREPSVEREEKEEDATEEGSRLANTTGNLCLYDTIFGLNIAVVPHTFISITKFVKIREFFPKRIILSVCMSVFFSRPICVVFYLRDE